MADGIGMPINNMFVGDHTTHLEFSVPLTSLTVVTFGSVTAGSRGGFASMSWNETITQVPEPATATLFLSGVALCLLSKVRRHIEHLTGIRPLEGQEPPLGSLPVL